MSSSLRPTTPRASAPPAADPMGWLDVPTLRALRDDLDARRERAARRLARLAADADDLRRDRDVSDLLDGAHTMASVRDVELSSAFARATAAEIAEIDEALWRMEVGAYGACEGCGEPLPLHRLEARPQARSCVPCAEDWP